MSQLERFIELAGEKRLLNDAWVRAIFDRVRVLGDERAFEVVVLGLCSVADANAELRQQLVGAAERIAFPTLIVK